jgi:hypothetical protein
MGYGSAYSNSYSNAIFATNATQDKTRILFKRKQVWERINRQPILQVVHLRMLQKTDLFYIEINGRNYARNYFSESNDQKLKSTISFPFS